MAITILKQVRARKLLPHSAICCSAARTHPAASLLTAITLTHHLSYLPLKTQVMEEKLDATNVEVASCRMPPAKPAKAVEAACHYVPGMGFNPQFATYTTEELEAALARVAAAAAS